jgi:two-component system nitrate/nitrite response regulator NarL
LIRVFILASVRLYREGLEHWLAGSAPITVVGTAASVTEAKQRLPAAQPDVLLLDLGLEAGLGAAREICAAVPATKLIALAVTGRGPEVIACAEAGISSYVTCDATLDELVAAIEGTARGETRCPPEVVAVLFERLAALAPQCIQPATKDAALTAREQQIVGLLARGLSNKEIARTLSIALPTVKNHVHNVLHKLQVERRGDAAGGLTRLPLPASDGS